MWPENPYDTIYPDDLSFNYNNCKRCVNRSSCGNKKSKMESSWCEKYRPQIKNKRKKKKK